MEKMENMENPKKLAVATIAGLTEVAGMAAPAMADETAADPMVGQTQSGRSDEGCARQGQHGRIRIPDRL